MTNSIGLAGGDLVHLPPQQGRVVYHQHGPFASRLAPTLLQKMLGEAPAQLWAALLVKGANPDGTGYEELAAEGYGRLPVSITSLNSDFDANVAPLVFRLSNGADVTHIGLFDDQGRLRFYGFLSGYRKDTDLPKVFELGAMAMTLRRLKAPCTDGLRPQLGSGLSH